MQNKYHSREGHKFKYMSCVMRDALFAWDVGINSPAQPPKISSINRSTLPILLVQKIKMFAVVISVTALPPSDKHGGLMVKAASELGYWCDVFRFRIFPDNPFKPKVGDFIEVDEARNLSKTFKAVKNPRLADFDHCSNCRRYKLEDETCVCPKSNKRIKG